MRGETREHPSDRAIAELARRQHGVVGRAQLQALGLGDDAIDWRVRRRQLHRVHRGVYVVGYPHLTRNGGFMAAVIACGEGAALSHFSGAVLWGMLASEGKIHVTTPAGRERPGLVVHRARFEEKEVRRRADIPVTTPARTLVDLADVAPRRTLERAIDIITYRQERNYSAYQSHRRRTDARHRRRRKRPKSKEPSL